jgi:transcriptional regulator with XRE-family HTH domain
MTHRSAGDRRPTEVDKLVGENIRRHRKSKGLTQQALGDHVGLSFKQIRKYEAGENRVSASMLYMLAGALAVGIEDMYHGLDLTRPDPLYDGSEAGALTDAFLAIRDPRERQAFLRLVREVADSPLFQ